jgi:hypothetical protein
MTRATIAKLEIALSIALFVLGAAHLGWCKWSLPRSGIMGPHGLETTACNWGTSLLGIALAVIALLTLASGLIGWRTRAKTAHWYASQVPAILGWGWLCLGSISSLMYE